MSGRSRTVGQSVPRIAILQFDADNPPGHLAVFLAKNGLDFEVLRLDLDPRQPLDGYDAYALMGGPMMVGDDLPWMARVIERLRRNIEESRPTLGHCLGGQLLAHAAGAAVGPCDHPEVGWIDVKPMAHPTARHWLGPLAEQATLPVYHWHLQAFTLPDGAEWILTRDEMPSQAFALGPHLGLQCHPEVDEPTLARWYALQPDPPGAYRRGTLQRADEALAQAPAKIAAMRALTERLYAQWLQRVSDFNLAMAKP